MNAPTTARWTALTLWVGDGGSPENFNEIICGITTNNFALAADHQSFAMPDCFHPQLPAWNRRIIISQSGSFAGSGVFAEDLWPLLRSWHLSGQARNARITLDWATGGYFSGAWILTELELSAQFDNGLISATLGLQSIGALKWIAAIPIVTGRLQIFSGMFANFVSPPVIVPAQFIVSGSTALQFIGLVTSTDWIDDIGETTWIDDIGETTWVDD